VKLNGLGRAIVDSDHTEERADEFASLVLLCEGERLLTPWIEDALGIQSGLLKFGAFTLIAVCAVAVCAQVYLGALCPHYEGRQVERQL
jgi:hypothetical protein